MKKTILALALLLLLPVAGAHADPYTIKVGDSVWLDDAGFGYPSGGGPFMVHDPAGNALFLTFCIERAEYFSPGQLYEVQRIDTVAIRGKYPLGNPGDTTPLAFETAFLYQQFVSNFDGDPALAAAYQMAIWKAQGQIPGDLAGLALQLYTDAQQAVASPSIWGQTIGNVRVLGFDSEEWLNEFGKVVETDRVQDMLVLVPEPASMLLLGTGLAGLIAARRRRR